MSDAVSDIKNEADRIEEDSLNSAKGHWVASELYQKTYFWFGILVTMASAITAWTAANLNEGNGKTITVIAALISAVSSALLSFVKPQKLAFEHHHLGNKYKTISNNARLFKNTCHLLDENNRLQSLENLQTVYNKMNEESTLIIPSLARRIAKTRIERGQHDYRVDSKNK